jgi:hypothetical protein
VYGFIHDREGFFHNNAREQKAAQLLDLSEDFVLWRGVEKSFEAECMGLYMTEKVFFTTMPESKSRSLNQC